METVHLLWHSHMLPQDEESSIRIGVYSSPSDAEAAKLRVCGKPGFIDHPDGFLIVEMTIGKDHWEEGFVKNSYEGKG